MQKRLSCPPAMYKANGIFASLNIFKQKRVSEVKVVQVFLLTTCLSPRRTPIGSNERRKNSEKLSDPELQPINRC